MPSSAQAPATPSWAELALFSFLHSIASGTSSIASGTPSIASGTSTTTNYLTHSRDLRFTPRDRGLSQGSMGFSKDPRDPTSPLTPHPLLPTLTPPSPLPPLPTMVLVLPKGSEGYPREHRATIDQTLKYKSCNGKHLKLNTIAYRLAEA